MNVYVDSILLTANMKPRMFDLDFQLLHDAVLTLISVFVLYLALSYFLFNPVRAMLEKRQTKIASELAEAAYAEKSAKALCAEYEKKLACIEKEADEILGDARKRALISENQIITDAKKEARHIMDRARVEAELEKNKVTDEVKKEMIQVASMLAAKVVAANINTRIQKNLIDETLKEIGKSTWLS